MQCVAACCHIPQNHTFCTASHTQQEAARAVMYTVLQCVAVCCSVLQCVAVCCSVLQGVATYPNSPHPANHFTHSRRRESRDVHGVAVCCSVLPHTATVHIPRCCSVRQCVAVCGSVLQCVAACCHILQTAHIQHMGWLRLVGLIKL